MGSRKIFRGWLIAGLALGSCGEQGASTDPAGFLQQDSSGVIIAVNSTAVATRPLNWLLELDLQIGQIDGSGPQSFSRIAGVRQLSDRRIAVLDGGSKELRLFDEDGEFQVRAGGEGSGPGEFRNPQLIAMLPGDSLVILDQLARRLTIYSGDGGGHRDFAGELQREHIGGWPIGLLGDAIVLTSSAMPMNLMSIRGPISYSTSLRRAVVNSSASDTLLQQQAWANAADLNGALYMLETPFSAVLSAAVGANQLYASDGFQIFRYSSAGSLQQITRTAEGSRPLAEADYQAAVEERVARFEGGNIELGAVRRAFDQLQTPELRPEVAGLIVDERGWLWARTYDDAGVQDPTWWVFDPQGRLQGNIRTPSGFEIHQIGHDFLLGTWLDELDVEYVRRYSLVRGD